MDKPISPFAVSTRELPCTRDFTLEPSFIEGAVADLPLRQALGKDTGPAGQAKAHVELYGEHDNVIGRGTLKGWLEVACSRCVNPVRVPVEENLEVTFMPKDAFPEDASDEDDVDPDEADVYPYENKQVDFEPLFREQLILSVPYAPLCKEDCKGLCPQCGVDKNQETCNCQPIGDPRLAGLRDLKV